MEFSIKWLSSSSLVSLLVVSEWYRLSDWHSSRPLLPHKHIHEHQEQPGQMGQDFSTMPHPIPLLLQYCMLHLDLLEQLTLQHSAQKGRLIEISLDCEQKERRGPKSTASSNLANKYICYRFSPPVIRFKFVFSHNLFQIKQRAGEDLFIKAKWQIKE